MCKQADSRESDAHGFGEGETVMTDQIERTACGEPAKWAVLVDDVVVPMPQRSVKVRVICAQANVPEGFVLVRDHNSPHDVILNDDQEIDLANGNVFYRLAACDIVAQRSRDAPPKLAFVVDDRWEVTIQPHQKTKSLRGLFDIPDGVDLFRDFESPIDDPIEEGELIDFKDGPVFITRKVESREITIIVRGRPRKVNGYIISFISACCPGIQPRSHGALHRLHGLVQSWPQGESGRRSVSRSNRQNQGRNGVLCHRN